MDVCWHRQDCGVDVSGSSREFQEEGCGGGVGDGERVAGVAVGHGLGVGEGGAGGDFVEEEEVGAGDGAGQGCVGGALKLGERGQADDVGQGEPVAGGRGVVLGVGGGGFLFRAGGGCGLGSRSVLGGARREDRAHVEGTEGAWAEGAEWVEGSDDGVGVLEEQTAGGRQCEDGAEGAVEGFDLQLTVAGGKLVGLLMVKVRTELRARSSGFESVIVEPVGTVSVLRRSVMTGRAEEMVTGTDERTAVTQGEFGCEVVVDMGRGRGGVSKEGENCRMVEGSSVAAGYGREDEITEGELVDLCEGVCPLRRRVLSPAWSSMLVTWAGSEKVRAETSSALGWSYCWMARWRSPGVSSCSRGRVSSMRLG